MAKRYNWASASLTKTKILPRKIFITGAILTFLLANIPLSSAAIVFGDAFVANADPDITMSRGAAVSYVVESFNLKRKFGSFIRDCFRHPDDCFFVFSTMSDYDEIRFSPLILYPDVFPAHENYRAINMATMLGLVHGFLEEDNSPFHPEIGMTRIQALKVILGAADLMKWKDRFEMTDGDYPQDLPFEDEEIGSEDGWWYGRYLKFALDTGIIDGSESFRPDHDITATELTEMVSRTLSILADAQKTV